MEPGGLIGEWRLQRRVADRRLSSYGWVDGFLTIEEYGDGLAWREHGTLTIAGRSHAFTRAYRIEDGWVLFDDGRPFHPWTPGQHVTHLCGEDTYRGLIDVTADRIRTLWDVRGPAKDQRLLTRLQRLAE